jgi:hypothetical protein
MFQCQDHAPDWPTERSCRARAAWDLSWTAKFLCRNARNGEARLDLHGPYQSQCMHSRKIHGRVKLGSAAWVRPAASCDEKRHHQSHGRYPSRGRPRADSDEQRRAGRRAPLQDRSRRIATMTLSDDIAYGMGSSITMAYDGSSAPGLTRWPRRPGGANSSCRFSTSRTSAVTARWADVILSAAATRPRGTRPRTSSETRSTTSTSRASTPTAASRAVPRSRESADPRGPGVRRCSRVRRTRGWTGRRTGPPLPAGKVHPR